MRLIEFLNEVYHTRTARSYWINPDANKVIPLASNAIHSQYVFQNPYEFGFAPQQLLKYRNMPLDDMRDNLMGDLFRQGWVRVGSSMGNNIEVQTYDEYDAAEALKIYLDQEGDVDGVEIEVQGSWYQLPKDRINMFLKSPANLHKLGNRIG